LDIREIGRLLNVTHVLEGSVRKAGSQIRITAQLIDVADGYHLWSERYDRELEDVFTIQDEISMAIVDNLRVKLLGMDKAIITKRITENIDAYHYYLMGRYFLDKTRKQDIAKSIQDFNRAIEFDSQFAQAYAGLADAFFEMGYLDYQTPSESFPKAKSAATRAMEIDTTLTDPHRPLGLIKMYYDWDWEGAEKELKYVVESNPNNALAHRGYAHYFIATGNMDNAIAELQKSIDLDPLSVVINAFMGVCLLRTGQTDRARRHLQKTMELVPNHAHLVWMLGQIDIIESRYDQGIPQIEQAASMEKNNPMILAGLGWSYAVANRAKDAQNVIEQLEQMSKKQYIRPYLFAKIYNGLGNKNRAFQWLSDAYEQHDISLANIVCDETMKNLHSDERFVELLKKIRLDKYL
jgi:tetratricopeptide (TPR) repeat protein